PDGGLAPRGAASLRVAYGEARGDGRVDRPARGGAEPRRVGPRGSQGSRLPPPTRLPPRPLGSQRWAARRRQDVAREDRPAAYRHQPRLGGPDGTGSRRLFGARPGGGPGP